jgi:hypothetical protein
MATVTCEPGDIIKYGDDLIVCVKGTHGIQITKSGKCRGISDGIPPKLRPETLFSQDEFQKLPDNVKSCVYCVRQTTELLDSLA